MADDYQSPRPIYMQIVDKIMLQVARNELKPGQKLPSVREMAIESGVNPNTVQRTYGELERMQIVETKRGQGTFITKNKEIVEEMRKKLQFEVVDQFISKMKELGMTEAEMIDQLHYYMKEREGE
ncbi:GntR family transcriptional regulator [Niallia sp. 03133]|uniref:GntR family transcriptional regulator n=1 Tax=Niallia sp. 03133 TaxID=3458060 RepID=UPI004044923D